MIQSTLLAALGFLTACLMFLFIAPAFWARAVRLTTQKIRQSLPISEAEIRASKDLIRAEYAVKVHQLTKAMEKARLAAHRQTIEINRRDAALSRQTTDISQLTLDLSEHQNAHAVLKQTMNDRLPKLEAGIEDARRLLDARDGEIRGLEAAAGQQAQALEEARTAYAQLQSELERMRLALATAQGQDRRRVHDLGVETEIALRSELDSLRAMVHVQADTIERLQAGAATFVETIEGANGSDIPEGTVDVSLLRARMAEQSTEIRQLRRDLTQSEDKAAVNGATPEQVALLQQMRALESRSRDLTDDNQRLRDEIDRLEKAMTTDAMKPVVESKAFLKTRLERIEAQAKSERETTGRLRAELAAANERAARQAVYFRDELRRLGSRGLAPVPATATARALAERSQNAAAAAVAAATAMAARSSLPGGEAPVASLDRRAIWASRLEPVSPPPRAVVGPALTPIAHASVPAADVTALTSGTGELSGPEGLPVEAITAGAVEREASLGEGIDPVALAAGERRARLSDRLRTYDEGA